MNHQLSTLYSRLVAVSMFLMVFIPCLWADGGKTITGRIVDAAGEPLTGAVVRIEGTKIAAVADIDGNYVLTAGEQPAGFIVATYMGYDEFRMAVKAVKDGRLDIVMHDSAAQVDEVVVLGYGSMKKESLSAAITNISAKDLSRTAAINTSGALAGKIAGINSRQSDGRPGAYTAIKIRNMGTPLYVVDGVQTDEGQFNNIDFNDIESISVLKDASAAIYGVRAANGVVVVKTKTGRRNQPCRISMNSYYGWQSMFRFPEPADAATYVKASIQSTTIQGTTPHFTEEEYEAYTTGSRESFDWKDFIWRRSAPQWYAEVNATGGSEKISYYMAASHTRQESLAHDFGHYERTNMQLNVDADITRNFRVRAQVNGRLENNKQAAWNASFSGADAYWTLTYAVLNNLPTQQPYANGNPDYPAMAGGAGYTNFANLTMARSGVQNDNWRVLQGNITGEWTPLKGLTVKGLFSYFNSNERFKARPRSYSVYYYDEGRDAYNPLRTFAGRFDSRWQYIETINSQLSANYEHSWADKHHLTVFGGMETYKTGNPGVSFGGTPAMDALKVAYFNELTSFREWNENTSARLGYMGRINYDYGGRYLLEMAARYDGSWMFPPHHRWGFFPSASAAWRISEEAFWKKWAVGRAVDNLKLRISYGVMGDDNVSGYSAFAYLGGYNYNTGRAVVDGQTVNTTSVRSLPLTEISWLKAKTFDAGIDVGILSGRLTGSIDYFQRLRTGLPASRYDVVVPSEIGFSWPIENLNSDMVRGFDASLTWTDHCHDFYYSAGGNITLARNYNWHQYKPTFGNSRDYYVYNAHERYAGHSFMFNCIGQFQSWEQIAAWPVDIDGKGNSTLRPGDLIYEDTNKDGIITNDDQQPIGHLSYTDWSNQGGSDYTNGRTPILNYNVNLSAAWRGFDVAIDMAGMAFFTRFFNYEARNPFHGDGNHPQYMLGDQWHLADPYDADSELIPGTYPTLLYGNSGHSNYRGSTFWSKEMWFLKLRNLQLGYTVPTQWLKTTGVHALRVYCLMQNLCSIDNMHKYGVDPEMTSVTGTSYPTTRIVNIGINITF